MAAQRFHIIIDIKDINSSIVEDEAGLKKFLEDLPGVIDMHVLYPPVVTHGIPENPGLSGFVLIDYSHISIHTFTQYNQALVDIFSCKSYDQEVATEAALKYFQVSRQSAKIETVSWE